MILSAYTKPKARRKSSNATTHLQKINKAQSQLRQAWNLIKGQEMQAEYIHTAMAQIAVAYKNLEDYRRHQLMALPSADNELLLLAAQVLPKRSSLIGPQLLPGVVDPIINVPSERMEENPCQK